jgi:hypothetical protein
MAEIIVVHNKPKLSDLLQSHLYKKINLGLPLVLEDFNGHRASCDLNEEGEVEYISDYLSYDPYLFADTLRARFDVHWVEQSDLIEYNKHAFTELTDYEDFVNKLQVILDELQVKLKHQKESEYLWKKLNSQQRAKALPKGYLRNYMLSKPTDRRQELDLLELFDDCLKDRLVFGLPVQM